MPTNLCHDLVDEVYGAVVAMPNPDRTELDALCSDALVSVLQVFRSSASTVGMCRTFSDKVAASKASDAEEIDVDDAKASWCKVTPASESVKVLSRAKHTTIQRETEAQAQVPVRESSSEHGKHTTKHGKHHHSKKHRHLRTRKANEVHLGEHVEHVEDEVASLAQTTDSEVKSWASGVTAFLAS